MLHVGPIWYHLEPLDVPYSQNLPRPISWFELFLQQNDSSKIQTMSRTVGSWLILSGVIWHITPNCDPRIDNDDIGVCFGCYGNIFIHTRVIGMY